MRYIAAVTIAFPTDAINHDEFDIWENLVAFEAQGSTQALQRALTIARETLDDSENWRALGYLEGPCFYAIKSLHTEPDLPKSVKCNDSCMMLFKAATLNESELKKIKAFDNILVPYRIMHLG